jgi:hypothetical protein
VPGYRLIQEFGACWAGGAPVEDIISHGDDQPPGTRRRRLLVAAALVVVVALVIVEHLPHAHRASPPGGNHVAGIRGAGHRSFRVRLRVGSAILPPSGITGRTPSWAPDARVPRTGAQPAWFWPAMGRVATIRGLPSDRFGYVFTRVDGGWAIQPDPPRLAGCSNCTPPAPSPGPASCGDCTGPPTPVFYLADRAGRAVMVGSASLVAPAAAKGQMWLTTFPPESDLNRTPGVAQRYSGSGAAIGAPITLPAGYGITQGTRRGLLLESLSLSGPGNADRLWDPATGRVLHRFYGVLAVNATAVAYAPPCGLTCPVHVYNVRAGREVTVKMRPTDVPTSGVFSPDGRFLALLIGRGNADVSDGGASAIELQVASAATGRAVVVPRILVSSDALAAFGWPGSRDDLVVEFRFDGAVQMGFWDPVARGNVALADIKPAENPAALIVG